MSDELIEEREDDTDLVKQLRAALRDQQSQNKQTAKELAITRKQSAFRDAGLDPSSGVGSLLFNAFDGDPTPDAVRAAAQEYGIDIQSGTTTAAPEPPKSSPSEQAAHRTIDAATTAAPPASPPDPTEQGWEAFQQARQRGASGEDAMAAHFSAKLQQAAKAAQG